MKKIELQRVSPDKSCRLLHTGQKVVISKCLKYPFCVTSNFFMQKSREAPQKCTFAQKCNFLKNPPRKPRPGPPLADGKQCCSRTGDRGLESPHSEGEIRSTEQFCPTTTVPIPVFLHKMFRERR